MAENMLEVRHVEKRFGENVVLRDVSFALAPGEILGLVGENGAGKSTLMNIIFGMEVIRDTGGFDGEILLNGEPIDFKSPIDALDAGIGMVHQEFNLIPGFTAAENITFNMERTKQSVISSIFGKKYATIDTEANIALSGESLDTLGVAIDPRGMVSEMPVGHKQFIEIAREITREDVKLIIMDEPTAVLTESEADQLMAALKRLSDLGIAIIFITHRLREILNVCDSIVVLRDGEIVERRKNEGLNIDQIAAWMVAVKTAFVPKREKNEERLLRKWP